VPEGMNRTRIILWNISSRALVLRVIILLILGGMVAGILS